MYSAVIRRAARLRTALLALGTLLSPAALALDNGDFSELRVEYADRQALPGWTPILTDEGARPDARLVVEAVDFAYAGVAGESGRRGNVAYFDTLTDGFGVNKLDQCVAFDRSQPLTINVPLRTNAPISNDLRARVNPGFYADMASCEADIQADSTDGRLSGSNLDWDVRFATAGAASNEWLDFEATHGDKKGPILYAANSTPADAAVVRISLRARDDSAAPDRRIYFGAVEVSNGAAEIEVANARFDRLQVLPGQYLVEDGQQQGWRVVAGDLRVEQHPPGFAATGVNVLRYGELMEGFGDSRLDQCVELPQFHDFGVSLQARSDSPHKDLRVRVAVAWFADANCINELDELDDEDFQIKGAANANTWQLVETNRTALADIPVDATHARISLRARDRTGMTPAPMLYLDAVRLRGVLAVSPAGGSYSAEELPTVHLDTAKSEPLEAGWTLHYTLTPEPTDPTLSSAELTAEGVEIDSSGWLSLAVFDKDGSQVGGITRTYYQILVGEPPEFVGLGDAVAGVVGDSSDPVATQGLSFELADVESDAAALQLSLTSSNPDVVPDANLQVERDENQVVLRIVPEGVGFSDIQLALEDEHGNVTTHTLHYAASAHPQPDTTHTRWYTGRADLSTAVSLDDDFMLVFDDEGDYERSPPLANGVLVFDLSRSGAPVADLSAVVDAELDLANSDNCELDGMTGIAARCSTDGEVDYEAAVRLNDRIYVTGSHSNNRNGRARP
ncbi:MAG: hypothetical protein M0Q49_11295, partial [Porticoccaceae bacterium]|nr:hypothetical protein [Porticoccaceae bacterium]